LLVKDDFDAVIALTDVYTPHSAPPGVTIGNFGFLNTFEDNFDTK
jgi:hypothetical protein